MTRRERLQAKVQRREQWAANRRSAAASLDARNEPYRGDWAFNTQPGHIPERARAIARTDQAIEHRQVAEHHEAKAAGLSDQLDHSIYSDDPDAVAELRRRIEDNEAKRVRMVLVNRLFRRRDARGLAELGLDLARLEAQLAGELSWNRIPHPGWELANLGKRIQSDRERIKTIGIRAERTAKAENSGGVVVEGDEYVRVTFAEKPERAVLTALRAAGFRWGGGSWVGRRDRLPAGVEPPAPAASPILPGGSIICDDGVTWGGGNA
jgi:hypothetical protein